MISVAIGARRASPRRPNAPAPAPAARTRHVALTIAVAAAAPVPCGLHAQSLARGRAEVTAQPAGAQALHRRRQPRDPVEPRVGHRQQRALGRVCRRHAAVELPRQRVGGLSFPPRWGMVIPEEIERVDVMYGPFSAAYPGNSVGAVVAFTTRMPQAFEFHTRTRSARTPRRTRCRVRSRAGPARWPTAAAPAGTRPVSAGDDAHAFIFNLLPTRPEFRHDNA